MSKKGYAVLKAVLSSFQAHIIDCVILSKDNNISKDYATEILNLCKKNHIRVYDRNENYQITSSYALAISWRWIIPYSLNQTQLIVFHDSLLPKYRGFAPLVNQLIHREPTVGVTAFLANTEFDKGPIINQERTSICYPIKINDAIAQITVLYQNLALKIFKQIKEGEKINTVPQNEEDATYSLWRDTTDYKINWNDSALTIQRFVHAVGFPYLGATTLLKEKLIRILDVEIEKDVHIVNRDPGKVLFVKEHYPIVVCGKGLLRVTEAVYDDTKTSILPLKNFRSRFI